MENKVLLEKQNIVITSNNIYTIKNNFKINDWKTVILNEPSSSPTWNEDSFLAFGSLLVIVGILFSFWCIFTIVYRFSHIFNKLNELIVALLNSLHIYQITINTHILFIISLLINGLLLINIGYKIAKLYFNRNYKISLIDKNNNKTLLYETESKEVAIDIVEIINREIVSKNNLKNS